MKKLFHKRHKIMMWFWIIMIPITLMWLKDSVVWIALMSCYANIEASAAAQAAKD